MNKLAITTALLVALAVPSVARAERIKAELIGFEEVPSVSTNATGEFRARIKPGDQSIEFELRYSGLQGTVQQSHIHVGQKGVNGGIVIWLCQTGSNLDPTGLAATCPAGQLTEAFVEGTITSANVVAVGGNNAGQQLGAGELAEAIRAIRAGVAYVNVHTNLSPGGEIRGQIRARHRDDDRD